MRIPDGLRFRGQSLWAKITILGAVLSILVVLYLNSHPHLVMKLQHYGMLGAVLSILAMTLLCLTPIPSESLLFVLLKVYGVAWGALCGWCGLILSNIIIFVVIRRLGNRWSRLHTYPKWFAMIDNTIARSGRRGLLISRLLPIPAFFTSIIITMMPSVGFADYLWTSAVSVIPYYTGIIFIFKGLTGAILIWLPIGLIFLLLVSLFGSKWARRHTGI